MNYMQQPMLNPEDISDPTTAMNMALILMVKAFKLNYSTPTNNNQRISSNPRNRQIAQSGMNMGQDRHMQMVGGNGGNQFRQYAGQNVGNQNGYNAVQNNVNQNGNGNVVAARAEVNGNVNNGNRTQLMIAQKEEARIQLQAEEFDLMAATGDLDEIEEVNANCILMANLQQASTSGTHTDNAPVYDSDGSVEFLGTVRFGNDHIAAILGYGDRQWGNILIIMVYSVEGLRHNLFSVRQFCDSDLEVAFRRNTCFVRNLEGVDLLKGNRTINLYNINLYEMASASPICLMAHATSTKSWLWHQRLSHLNFDTINDLAQKDLVISLPKFKYHKEHLCPSCEQGKSKKASHPPKPVPNSKQRLHLLHMDLCGPMRVKSINGKRTPQQNGVVKRRNQTLVEAARTMLIFSCAPLFLWAEAIATACYTQNRSIIHRRFDKTPYELINGIKPDISFLHVFGALCYPKNDREDIGKLGAKGDIGFFIAMAFEQRSSKPGFQSMTSGQISSEFDLNYAPSTITSQKPTDRELDLLFEAILQWHLHQQHTAQTPTNSPSQAANIPNTSQDVDELDQQQHDQQQKDQSQLQTKTVANNVPNAMLDGNAFVNPFAQPSTREPSRPVLTRNQLRTEGDMCIYALTVSTMEPRNDKEAMTDPAWIDSMQEELL
ncbi:retrovirus-related pol polyprotein from transposon TNT 1-94 [Tanacetum coccineum]